MKLVNTHEFASVFNYRKKVSSNHLVLHYSPNKINHYRLGFIISKRFEKLAVKRNYMRRSLREIIKQDLSSVSAFDIIVKIKKSFYKDGFSIVRDETQQLLLLFKR
jgi:ribonuclease P protein component